MAHGTPDWGGATPTDTITSVQDLGELAARLGALSRYERSGNLVFADDFQCGLGKWVRVALGTGSFVEINQDYTNEKLFACKMYAENDGLHQARIVHTEMPLVLSRYGLEYSFMTPSSGVILQWGIHTYDGVNQRAYAIQWRESTKKLYYQTGAAAWTEFASDVDLFGYYYEFNNAKLVIDPTIYKFKKLFLNATAYDLSAYSPYATADATRAQTVLYFAVDLDGATGTSAWVSRVILTQNEP